jgi:hypothetical protein
VGIKKSPKRRKKECAPYVPQSAASGRRISCLESFMHFNQLLPVADGELEVRIRLFHKVWNLCTIVRQQDEAINSLIHYALARLR